MASGKPTITVVIETDGSCTIAVEGCAGPECERLTANLEKAIGTVRSRERTAEYRERETERPVKVRQ